MIRIDEYYTNVLWAYIKNNIPLTRLFYCDPPGRSDPDSLYNYGSDTAESNYILMHDQEPIHFDYHGPLFDDAVYRNLDLNNGTGPTHQAIITSEYNSESVANLQQTYNWKAYYFFYHGWAALDWYRGYNRTFLRPENQNINQTFLFPNNIVGGKRKHRIELFYELEQRDLIKNNFVSFPKDCPYEDMPVKELCKKYNIPEIKTQLPLILDKFDNHANNSHELSLWEYTSTSLLQLVSETVFYGKKQHLTEKTFKPIAMQQPFVLASCKGSLQYLKGYGFETFSSVWDESYDHADDDERCRRIASLLEELEQADREYIRELCKPIVEHNYNHFYNGGFETILWEELTTMLEEIKNDFCI